MPSARQRAPLLHRPHQQVRVAELVGDIPLRDVGADGRGHVIDGPERHVGDAEGDDGRRVVVADGAHVGARLVDRAMDRPLDVGWRRVAADLLTGQREALQVRLGHELRPERAGDEVVVRTLGVADADVAEGVEHALVGQDAVGGDEVAQDGGIRDRR